MSILVKGVDMPTSCTGCGFVRLGGEDDFICTATRNKQGNPNYRSANRDGRPPYCPLVEVSDGTVDPRDRDIAVGKDCRDCVEWDTCPCGKEGHEKGTSMGYSSGECKHYCDRNICMTNELNGVGCDECVVAQNHNLEDDDSPCLNCEEAKDWRWL